MKLQQILAEFRKPPNSNIIAKKPVFSNKSGKRVKVGDIDYIHWYDLISELDRICKIWSWEIRTQFLPDRCVIEGRLTVYDDENNFCIREATGVEMLDSNGYGDPVYSAEASALRRAMAKFGYALDLWRKDKPMSDVRSQMSDFRTKTVKTNLKSEVGNLKSAKVTEKQIARLYAIAKKEAGLNDDDIKRIIKDYANYTTTKDIIQGHYDAIVDRIKAARFLTELERKELRDWWRIEKIPDDVAKKAVFGCGFEGTGKITRIEVNAVKSAILKEHEFSVSKAN